MSMDNEFNDMSRREYEQLSGKNNCIPKPTYVNYNFFNNYCGCFKQEPEYKTDCYFFADVQDMGAHIPTCNYNNQLGYCPCENCKKYIKQSEVFQEVKQKVDSR